MFKKESDKKTFTARDIDRYHNGLMTPAERNALERAALGDPFLEEAMEGFALRPAGSIPGDLEELHSRLGRRIKRDDNRSLLLAGSWWKVAAVAILIVGAGSLFYRGWQKAPPPGQQAREELTAPKESGHMKEPAPQNELAIEERKAKAPEVSMQATTPAQMQATVPAHSKRIFKAESGRRDQDQTPAANDSTVMQIQAADLAAQPAQDGKAAGQAVSIPEQRNTAATLSGKAAVSSPGQFTYNNRVTDLNHQPVPYASVRVLPSGNITTTDSNGHFSIKADDSTAKVSITAIGFDAKQYPAYQLADSSSLTLTERSDALKELVLVGYSAKHKSYVSHPYHADTDSTVEPIDGWSSYSNYLTQNLQLPDEVLRNNIHGEVTLSFRVDPVGNAINISVKKSLCASCDAEAIRLVKKGPQWKTARHKKKAKGLVKVHF